MDGDMDSARVRVPDRDGMPKISTGLFGIYDWATSHIGPCSTIARKQVQFTSFWNNTGKEYQILQNLKKTTPSMIEHVGAFHLINHSLNVTIQS